MRKPLLATLFTGLLSFPSFSRAQGAFEQEIQRELAGQVYATGQMLEAGALATLQEFVRSPFFSFTIIGLGLIMALLLIGHTAANQPSGKETATTVNRRRRAPVRGSNYSGLQAPRLPERRTGSPSVWLTRAAFRRTPGDLN